MVGNKQCSKDSQQHSHTDSQYLTRTVQASKGSSSNVNKPLANGVHVGYIQSTTKNQEDIVTSTSSTFNGQLSNSTVEQFQPATNHHVTVSQQCIEGALTNTKQSRTGFPVTTINGGAVFTTKQPINGATGRPSVQPCNNQLPAFKTPYSTAEEEESNHGQTTGINQPQTNFTMNTQRLFQQQQHQPTKSFLTDFMAQMDP